MLHLYSSKSKKIEHVALMSNFEPDAVWYDLFNPESEEIKVIEETLNLRIPTLEDMIEIESSSRLYTENESLYMTFIIITSADSDHPISSPVTLILNDKQLITVRHSDPKAFQKFYKKVSKNFKEEAKPDQFFFGLLETIVDRIADILEMIGAQIEEVSKAIFKTKPHHSSQHELHNIIVHLGTKGDLCTKIRESLENIDRLLTFFNIQTSTTNSKKKVLSRISTLQQDVSSVINQVSFLFTKISFLLDATLGLINIEQNTIIKIFSVMAVIFLPPTLIAGIYGMNFKQIPELEWVAGYPFAVLVIIISAILPYFYFKRKGWL